MSSPESKLKTSPQSWDDSDDELLIRLKEVEHLGWKQIANYFNNRTSNACQFRWRRLKSGQLKKTGRAKRYGLERTLSDSTDDHSYNSNSESESITSQRIINSNYYPHSQNQQPQSTSSWTPQEDTLILSRNVKGLTIMELSILLSNRTGKEIEERIKFLEKQKKVSVNSLISDNSSDVEQDVSNSRNSSSSSIATVSSFNNNINNNINTTKTSTIPLPQQLSLTSSLTPIPSKYPQQYHYQHQFPTPTPTPTSTSSSNQSITLPPLQNLNMNSNNLHHNYNITNRFCSTIPMFKYGDNSQRDQRLPSLSQVYSFISQ